MVPVDAECALDLPGPVLQERSACYFDDLQSFDSAVIREIIDEILDTFQGGVPNEKLRKEMEMAREVFPLFNVYELFIWSFEENAPDVLGELRTAIARIKEGVDISIVATAVGIRVFDAFNVLE